MNNTSITSPAASRAAFTLIELLTVIAIIGILAAIIIPAISSVQRPANPANDRLAEGKFSAAYLYHCHIISQPLIPILTGPEPTAEHFREWFERYCPDAIVTLVTCADEWLRALEVEPGRDIGLVHLDSTEVLDWAAVDQHFTDVGSACVDLVVGQIHRGEQGVPDIPKIVTIDIGWREGNTVTTSLRAHQQIKRSTKKTKKSLSV